mmetsp:Transcript_152751/g.488034  ORF Transcript_152751/g.488034 Transcript_152751/m.488034 type:complete len:284 (+) Transcript_152751:92-943(+)
MALRRVLLHVAVVTPLAALAAVPLQECDSTDTCAPFEDADSTAMLQTKSLALQEQASTEKIPNPAYAPKLAKGVSCCLDEIAECGACQRGTTVETYCQYFPATAGCRTTTYTDLAQVEVSKSPPIYKPKRDPSRAGCCKASTAACFACQADTTEKVWCMFYPSTEDCPKKLVLDPSRPGCCKASTAACFACQADTTETVWCHFYPSTEDCPKKLVLDPLRAGCCKASTATCLACQADTTVAVWCASYPSTQFCPKAVKKDDSSSWKLPGIGDLSKLNPFGQYR